jgi:hypothetical protein
MRRFIASALVIFLALAPARAEQTQGRVLRESWYQSLAETGRLGTMRLLAHEVYRDGQRLIHTTVHEDVSYLRSGDPYSDSQEQETLETPSGQVVEIRYSVTLSKQQRLRVRGTVEGTEMVLHALDDKGQPTPFARRIPWPSGTLGLFAQDRFFEGKKLRPGDVFTIHAFNVYANCVVPITYTVRPSELTAVGREWRRLVRVDQVYAKEAYLTAAKLWLDASGRIVKIQEDDTTLFGPLMRELTDKETATAKFKPRVRDKEAPIAIDRPITVRRGRPLELVIRVRVEGEDQPGTLFEQDDHQRVIRADSKAVELRLIAKPQTQPPAPEQPPPEVPAEYRESNFFIRSDDPVVQQLAREAVGDEKEPQEQLRLIRKFVRSKCRGSYEVAFATADEVARTLEGDCSEMGVLAAAMCRAAGIPSRIVFGFVYDANHEGFAGHLWPEVYADGRWQPFDTTGVIDGVQAAYLKVASFSMKDVLNPDELVQVRRTLAGPMRIEVVEAK